MEMHPTAPAQDTVVREISLPLFQSKGWLMFLGVLMIISGVLTAFTIVGIIVAWLPIWMGVLLFQTANAVEAAQVSGQKEPMLRSMEKLKLYFTITGIVMLVYIIGTLLALGLGMFGVILDALNHAG